MPKKVARVEDVIRLGQKMNWREVKSPNGEVVEPEGEAGRGRAPAGRAEAFPAPQGGPAPAGGAPG